MFTQSMNLITKLKEIVLEIIKTHYPEPFGLYVVTESKPTTYKVNIRNVNKTAIQFDNVVVSGMNLGNMKGNMSLPVKDDMVLVAFIDKRTPIVIGSLYGDVNVTGNGYDVIPQLKENELLICNKEQGATMHVKGSDEFTFNKGTKGVARLGDEVTIIISGGSSSGTHTGTITSASENIKVD